MSTRTAEGRFGTRPSSREPQPAAGGPDPFELVVVTYRSRSQLEGMLANLPEDVPVAVVDNSGNVDGIRETVAERPHARYLDGGARGFAHAANLGASTSTYEFIVFGNPDSRPTICHLQQIVTDVAGDPACASSAAMVVGGDGRPELGTAGWEPSLPRAVAHALGLHKIAPEAGLFARPRPGGLVEIDWTTGACMAVRRETFLSIGGFDERFYVYNEDVAFGRVARHRGLHQRLRTDILVPHATGGSGAPSREMLRLRGASMARYVRDCNTDGTASAIAAALAAGYLGRALLATTRGRNDLAVGYWEYVKGVVTARASVAGEQVYGRYQRGASSLSPYPEESAEERTRRRGPAG